MSLKLCCGLPYCLKSARVILLASEQTNYISTTIKLSQSRWLSSNLKTIESEKRKNVPKPIYYGILAPHMKAVKLFSISSSLVGIIVQPFLYKEIVSTGNVPIILAAYSFIGFFTVVTPLLLHLITKKYVIQLSYNENTDSYVAKTLNIFCRTIETEFKAEDVVIPDVPGMFVSFHVKGKPLFLDPRYFDYPEHYAKLMGFDKPLDLKLETDKVPEPNDKSSGSWNK
ncbi:hypothetical protein ABEB36_001951 [Hypothenemus hampei]|uniref:Transmembrane protein 70 n=1 Tax=Hypothenemus hampei TaxID=57062 RepID=A0ABD1FGB8_HYPHA